MGMGTGRAHGTGAGVASLNFSLTIFWHAAKHRMRITVCTMLVVLMILSLQANIAALMQSAGE